MSRSLTKRKRMPPQVTVSRLECAHCGYQWFPEIRRNGNIAEPKRCANRLCKTPNWNRPRVYKARGRTGSGHRHRRIVKESSLEMATPRSTGV